MNECPICLHGEDIFRCKVNLIYGSEYDLVECAQCGVLRFSPLPTENDLNEFYGASYFDFEKHKTEGKGMAFARKYLQNKPAGKFLDVGCATGFFINGIRQNCDWEVFGVDFSPEAVGFARKELGLNALSGELTEIDFAAAEFHFVHMNNVLEHVRDPLQTLKECRRIIKSDGTMFLSVPNGLTDSLDLINFYKTEKKPARSKNGHIFFFPAKALLRMIDEAGFEIMDSKTYGIRRGLRSHGLLPQKKNWKKPYYPREKAENAAARVAVRVKKKHAAFYYRYRFMQFNLKMLPGLRRYGLDFQLILQPK